MSKAKPIEAMMRISQCVTVSCCAGDGVAAADTVLSEAGISGRPTELIAWARRVVVLYDPSCSGHPHSSTNQTLAPIRLIFRHGVQQRRPGFLVLHGITRQRLGLLTLHAASQQRRRQYSQHHAPHDPHPLSGATTSKTSTAGWSSK